MGSEPGIRFQLKRSYGKRGANDPPSLRAHVLKHVELEFQHRGKLDPKITFYGDGFVDEGDLKPLLDAGDDEVLARMFEVLATRKEVVCGFREGELLLRKDGTLRRALAVIQPSFPAPEDGAIHTLEAAGEPGRPLQWWLATRWVGEGNGAIGIFLSEWELTEGHGFDSLPEQVAEWVNPGRSAIERFEMREQPDTPVQPEIRSGVMELQSDPPKHARGMAELAGQISDAEILAEGLKCLLLFTLRGQQVERWEWRGPLGCTPDDLLRNVATHAQAEAVAWVHVGIVNEDGKEHRALIAQAEMKGERAIRYIPLHFDEKGRAKALPGKVAVAPVPPGGGWIGVKPEVDLGLQTVGPEPWSGGPVGEG